MAGVQLAPPAPFNFRSPDEWPRWRRRYEQFQVASGLAAEAAVKQVSSFLYCFGEEAESVLAAMNASEADQKDYATIAGKFDAFFNVRRNIIFERARFNQRNQQPRESAKQYIMALYSFAANYNYGALEDEIIRDRLVVGIRDTAMSEMLQLDAELTLEKAKTTIRQREAVKEQQSILKGPEGANLDAMQRGKGLGGQRDRRDRGPQPRNDRPRRTQAEEAKRTKGQQNSVRDVGRSSTHITSALRGTRRATSAGKRATTERSAGPRESTSRTSRPRSSTPLLQPWRRILGTQIFWWESIEERR